VDFAIAFLVLAVVVALVVARPLRRPVEAEADDARRRALEATKEAKYREIRDAELDREMGKLSPEDWRAVDRELRAQAIAILRELDELEPADAGVEADAPRG
jgi:membrane protein implicated in regulation of membrane protease activity